MDIGFVWDVEKYHQVRKKHDVSFYEVVSAFDDPRCREVPDPQGHEDRHLMVARTFSNRVLVVVFSEEELPIYRIVTAYDAEGKALDDYRRKQRV